MIDMREYCSHKDYNYLVVNFQGHFNKDKLNCDDYWFVFKDLQNKISNNKCPICEVELSDYPNKDNTATLDHFRPKANNMYPHLKCEPQNYILMCSLCNSTYKKDNFPLVDDLKRATDDEEPLLLNPIEEDPLDFFELAFRQTQSGGILELKRKDTIPKNSYEYKRCERMIKMFGLGYCNKYIHPSDEAKNCRVEILTKHYTIFIEFAKARKNKKTLALFLRDKNRITELKKYGFFRFIIKEQFTLK
jgi:hypothetical protein